MTTKISNRDPENVRGITYDMMVVFAKMLKEQYGGPTPQEDPAVTIPQFINALKLLISYDVTVLSREDESSSNAGSAVRKYSTAFAQANGARGRGRAPRSAAADFDTADDD